MPHPQPAYVHSGECTYCEHGPKCLECPPSPAPYGPVCGTCKTVIVSAEIQADPYYQGDYVTMFGDDE
jgi:hypothetical protein